MTPSTTPKSFSAQQDFDSDYSNKDHIAAFAEALRADDNSFLPDSLPSPTISVTSRPATPGASGQYGGSTRIRKVSALSDFAPVNVKVKKRRKGHAEKQHEMLFLLFRWPLLFSIFLFIAFAFGSYILIRQLVNAKEYISAWRGRKGQLRKRLRGALSYDEWKDAARVLDEYLAFDSWKQADEDPFYDWRLVRKVKQSLRTFRKKDDARGVLGVLETCIRVNFAGLESPRLYSETYYGTKDLIESFITELEQALEYIRRTPQLSVDEKKRFFKSANTNFGLTALCLSGGASFGYYHFGVIKAFLNAGLLPRVITGTSAGGLVAALTCTRTDEELKELLIPELGNKLTACEEPFRVWFKRFWSTGARFDSILWAEKCSWFTRGSLTFREAYMRTGRILNVSVIPADRHSPTKVLNYITAPDTIIWSALLASAAVPGILNPVVLMQKLKDGRAVPWNWGARFKDGSLRVDIPAQALNLYFNVTNPVVSQVNPHVHLFFFGARGSAGKPVAHRKGKGWRGNFVLSAAEQWLKLELTKNFKLIRDLELLPTLLGQDWSSVFLQRFEGSITILPRTRFKDWFRILTDPDPQELERMMRVGQLVTWPKLHIIENRLRLEQQIYLGRQAVRKAQQPRAPHANGALRPRDGGLPAAILTEAATASTVGSSCDAGDPGMFLDTDGEAAFRNSAEWLQRHGITGRSTSLDTEQDSVQSMLLRPPPLRRGRVEDTFKPTENSVMFPASQSSTPSPALTPPVDPHQPLPPPPPPTGSLLHRLRTQSFQGFTPFSSIRSRASRLHLTSHSTSHSAQSLSSAWSSDSSSSDLSPGERPRSSYFHAASLALLDVNSEEPGDPFDEFS